MSGTLGRLTQEAAIVVSTGAPTGRVSQMAAVVTSTSNPAGQMQQLAVIVVASVEQRRPGTIVSVNMEGEA